MNRVICSSPGRVCMVGEDLDWTLGPSILCAINMRTYVTIEENPEKHIKIATSYKNSTLVFSLNNWPKNVNEHLKFPLACLQFVKEFGVKLTNISMKITSDLPIASGLSSSAAIILATIKCLFTYYGYQISQITLCHYAFLVESDLLKRNVGQMDLYSCGLGGILHLNSACCPPKEIIQYPNFENFFILIIDTLSKRDTSKIILQKQKRYFEKENSFFAYLEEAKFLVAKIQKELENSTSISKLGELLFQCQDNLKNNLKVSTNLINSCIQICRKYKVYGAKLTGTGFGGCLFALIESPVLSKNFIQELDQLPIKYYITSIDVNGVIEHI